jgi:chemotaxis protein MotA
MLFVIGFITVCVSVGVSYTHAGGNLWLLWQPAEISIIVGVGIGSILISSQRHTLKFALYSLSNLFRVVPYNKEQYMELLLFFFNATRIMKIKGLVAIENHIEHPDDSELFKLAPSLERKPELKEFIQSNLRLVVMGVDQEHQMDDAVDNEIDAYHDKYHSPGKLIHHFADALPALGIVAAVLGVIITMRSIAEPPEILGSLIGAALVGTFAGVLLSYGFFGPIAFFLTQYAEQQIKYLECVKIGILAYLQGIPPVILVEFMRKAIPPNTRPSFHEVEVMISANTIRVSN